MNEQRLGIVGMMVAVVLGGLLIAAFVLGGPGASPSPAPTPVASASPSAMSSEPVSASPTTTAAPTESPSAATSPTPEPTPTGGPTDSPTSAATATVMALKLDATDNPDGQDRELQLRAAGDGQVVASVIVQSPRGQAVMCLASPQQDLGCTTTSDGRLSTDHTGGPTDYTLTLRGDGVAEPIVDVTVSFPSDAPGLAITNARFDGTEFPDTNGLRVQVTPRAAGDLGLAADWGGHPFIYQIDLTDPGDSGSQTLVDQGPATRVDTSFPIEPPGPWQLVLENSELGFGPALLDATITWP